MKALSFGDIVLVPFPFTDQTASKKRPAVVVSSDTLHRESIDLVVMAITTQPRAASSLEVGLTQWRGAGLLRPSVIKPVLATIERSLVLKKLGSLRKSDRQALASALGAVLGPTQGG
jgi:mRNA-degrading endonuclease toxin of MazEF toxin-antitoxin module